ncbi:hypothetical protein ACF09L_25695 [Streptomyces sp. NPDC014779]|uniref:hypothetical protein n=1 Tax=unclassified Streptomyces TaxID=2593676 RepID=UPI00370061EE
MHADIHLTLHHLAAAERARSAALAAPAARTTAPTAHAAPVRVRLGWQFVEFGLRLALPEGRRDAAARAAHSLAA